MKKRIRSLSVGLTALCLVSLFGIKTLAGEVTQTRTPVKTENGLLERRGAEEQEKGIFTTKYRVSVNKATMRSGPGTSYPSLGTLYKNDIIGVRSISGGWAKFKRNSKWHYVSTNCIKKATY